MGCGCGDHTKMNKEKENIFDMSELTDRTPTMKSNFGFNETEKELEDLSFVKKTGAKDRSKDDPFANLGL